MLFQPCKPRDTGNYGAGLTFPTFPSATNFHRPVGLPPPDREILAVVVQSGNPGLAHRAAEISRRRNLRGDRPPVEHGTTAGKGRRKLAPIASRPSVQLRASCRTKWHSLGRDRKGTRSSRRSPPNSVAKDESACISSRDSARPLHLGVRAALTGRAGGQPSRARGRGGNSQNSRKPPPIVRLLPTREVFASRSARARPPIRVAQSAVRGNVGEDRRPCLFYHRGRYPRETLEC